MVFDHAIQLASLDIPHAQLIPKLRENMTVSIQKNDVEAISLSAKDIIEFIPEDLEANYYLAYSKTTELNSEYLASFFSQTYQSSRESTELIILHLIYHGPLSLFEMIKSYIKKTAPDYLDLTKKVEEVRQKKDESFSHSQTPLILYAEYDNILKLHETSVLIENRNFTTWTPFKDLSPQNSNTYSNHIRRTLRNAIGFFVYLSPHLFNQELFQDLLKLAIELNKPVIIYNPDQIAYDKTSLFKDAPIEFSALDESLYDYIEEKLNQQLSEQKIAASIFDIELFDEPTENQKPIEDKAAKTSKKKVAKKKVETSNQSQKPQQEKTPPLVEPTPSKTQTKSALPKKNRPKPKVVFGLVVFFLVISLIVLFQSPLFAAQEPSDGPVEEVIPVFRIDVSVDNVRMRIGEQLKIEATAIPVASNVSHFVWRSSNINVVSINSMGVIEALNPGTAQIEVKSGDISTFINVFVQEPTPTLVRTQDIDEINILFGTTEADLLDILPPSILIFDSRGRSHEVELKWQLFEFNAQNPNLAPARFIVSGIFDLPFNVELDDIPAQVNTFVNVGPALKSIETLNDVLVPLGESQTLILNRLPRTVKITDSIDNSYDALIDWAFPSEFNSNQAGETFTVKGNIILPEGLGTTESIPATVETQVRINVTNLETTEYTWQLLEDHDHLIARQPQTIRIRIDAHLPGLEGVGEVTLDFGLSDRYLRPGIEDITFIINDQRFLNYGQIQVFLERTGSLDLEIGLEINQATDFAEINFDISLDLDSIEYAFKVIDAPLSFPTDLNGQLEVSFSEGKFTLPGAKLNEFVQLNGTSGAIGRIEYIEFSLMKDDIVLKSNTVETLKSPAGTVIRTPNQLPSLVFDPFSSDWLIQSQLIVPNRLKVTYKLLGLPEQTNEYTIELSDMLFQEVSEFNPIWTYFGQLDTLENPANILIAGVVVSVDNNQIYLQDRSALNNKTMVFDIGSDVSNVTRGSHIVIEINYATPDKAVLIHVFADLQPVLIQVVQAPSINSIKTNFINDVNPARYSIAAGSSITYTATHVYIQSEVASGSALRFPLDQLKPFISESQVSDPIVFFKNLFPTQFPSITFTIKGFNAANDIEIIDIEIMDIEVTINTVTQLLGQEANHQAKIFFDNLTQLIQNAPITSITQTTISLNQEGPLENLTVPPLPTTFNLEPIGLEAFEYQIQWSVIHNPSNNLNLTFNEVTLPSHGQPDGVIRLMANLILANNTSIVLGSYDFMIPSLSSRLREEAIRHLQELIEDKMINQGLKIEDGVISRNQASNAETIIPIEANELNLTLNSNLKYTIRLSQNATGVIQVSRYNENELSIHFPGLDGPLSGQFVGNASIQSFALGHNAPLTSPAISGVTNIVFANYRVNNYHAGILEIATNELKDFFEDLDIEIDWNNPVISIQGTNKTLPLLTRIDDTMMPLQNGYYEWRWIATTPNSRINIDQNQIVFNNPPITTVLPFIYADLYYVIESDPSQAIRLTTDVSRITFVIQMSSIMSQFSTVHQNTIDQILPDRHIRLSSDDFEDYQLSSDILPSSFILLDSTNQPQSFSVTWSSNNDAIISPTGAVNLPQDTNAVVRLTATLAGPGLESASLAERTVSFDFMVVSKFNRVAEHIRSSVGSLNLTAVAMDTERGILPDGPLFGFNNFVYSTSNVFLFGFKTENNQTTLIQKAQTEGAATIAVNFRSSANVAYSFSLVLTSAIPKNEGITIATSLPEALPDDATWLDVGVDYFKPNDLTYSWIFNQELPSNQQFLPEYFLIEDSTRGLHALTLIWQLHPTNPTLSAMNGVTYQYQATLGELINLPWTLTPSSVLMNTPELNYLLETYQLNYNVTVKDRLINEKTTLQDRWVIVENNLTQLEIIEAILKETQILEVHVEDGLFPELIDVNTLEDQRINIEFPTQLFGTNEDDEIPSLGIFEVDWILSQDALYNQYGIKHQPLVIRIILQVIEVTESEVEN